MVARSSEHRVGGHVAWMGADGIAVQRIVGPSSFEELRSLARWESGFWEGRASVQVIIDLSEAGPLESSLQGITSLYNGAPHRRVAIVGASFAARSAANVVIRAVRILRGRTLDVRFCRDEAAGRAWLAELRAQPEAAVWV